MKHLSMVMGRGGQRVAGLEPLEARRMFNAASPPTVAFEQYVKGSGVSRTFAVFYDGVDSIDRTTLDNNDIRVFGRNDFSAQAMLVASAKTRHGNGLIARYRVDGLAGGVYGIEMGEGEVTDSTGAMVDPAVIGGFKIGKKGRTVVGDPQQEQFNAVVQVAGTTYGPSFAPPAIDTSFGTVIGALNFGGSAADVTGSTGVNVHFTARPAGAGSGFTNASPFSVSITSGTQNGLADGTVGSQPVYETEIYTPTQSDEMLTVSGLDPTRKYRFQFLHGDTRRVSSAYQQTLQYFSLPTGESATTLLAFNTTTIDADSNTVVLVSGTTGLTYQMPASSTRGPSFSGMVVEVADGGVSPQVVMPPAAFVRKSVRLVGSSQTFDLAFADGGSVTATGLAAKNVVVTGPSGYSARAALVQLVSGRNGTSQIATYRIDGVEVTGTYTVSMGGEKVADMTLFYLLPVKWDLATVAKRRHRAVG